MRGMRWATDFTGKTVGRRPTQEMAGRYGKTQETQGDIATAAIELPRVSFYNENGT